MEANDLIKTAYSIKEKKKTMYRIQSNNKKITPNVPMNWDNM